MALPLLGGCFAGGNDSDRPRVSFAKDDHQNAIGTGVADADEPIFDRAVIGIAELAGLRVRPHRLGFLEPDPVLLEVSDVLYLVPLELHNSIVCCCVYSSKGLHRAPQGFRRGRATPRSDSRGVS